MPNSELKAEALELFNAKEYAKALELYLYIEILGSGDENKLLSKK